MVGKTKKEMVGIKDLVPTAIFLFVAKHQQPSAANGAIDEPDLANIPQ